MENKLENLISRYRINQDDADWLRAIIKQESGEAVAQGGGVDVEKVMGFVEEAYDAMAACAQTRFADDTRRSCAHVAMAAIRNIRALLSASPAGAGGDAPYIVGTSSTREYNPAYGDDRKCQCGHPYYRHFDSYDDMQPVGCKYCECSVFKPAGTNIPTQNS